MEDDGMILNFAVPDSSNASTSINRSVKNIKGNWKQKRAAKRELTKKTGLPASLEKLRNNTTKFMPPIDLLKPVSKPITSLEDDFDQVFKGTGTLNKKQPTSKKLNDRLKEKPAFLSDDDSDSDDGFPSRKEDTGGAKAVVVSSLFTKNPTIAPLHSKSKNSIALEASNGILSSASSFSEAGLDKALTSHLKTKMGVSKPTSVQSKTISFLKNNSNNDVIIQAQTGSGKTLSFLLPIVNNLINASGNPNPGDSFKPSRTSGLLAVILAPTRELARQIYDVLEKLLNYPSLSDDDLQRYHWLVPGLVVGGDKKSSEKSRIRKGINILIATPGRFLDHLQNTKSIDADRLKWVILDEGDRFLELGLQETLKSIFQILNDKQVKAKGNAFRGLRGQWFWGSKFLPKIRQTLLVSATLNNAVQKLAEYSLTNPIHIQGSGEKVGDSNDSDDSDGESMDDAIKDKTFSTPQQLTQRYIVTPAKLRLVTLAALVKKSFEEKKGKVVVFMLTCEQVDFAYNLFVNATPQKDESDETDEEEEIERLEGDQPDKGKSTGLSKLIEGLNVLKLHGNLDQSARNIAYKAFCKLDHGVLFCTDVAARGLDMPQVAQIIQYDPPTDVKDYVHRVGRTARLGRAGDALLFLLPSESDYIKVLKSLKIFLTPCSSEEILKGLGKSSKGGYQIMATSIQNSFERYLISNETAHKQACQAYNSSIRAYATHPASEKAIFHIKKIHLGHWAKSFALRESPSAVVGAKNAAKRNKTDDEEGTGKKRAKSYRSSATAKLQDPSSEFAIGNFSKPSSASKRRR